MATAPATTTFQVTDDITICKTQHARLQEFSSEDLDLWTNKSNRSNKETLSFENGQTNYPLIDESCKRIKNAFIATVYKAYCEHYPLELSVEDFWVAIAQGVSIHVNQNSEKFRHLLVNHEGKKDLILNVDSLRIPESDRPANSNRSIPPINWPIAIHQICGLIQGDMKTDLTTLITNRFSNTTDVEATVFNCTLMDAVKSYYRYTCCLTCGIPQVTLRGTPADFQDLIDRVQQLKTYFTDFHWWFDALLPHLEKLKDSAAGKPDIDWWQRICHRNNKMSGVDLLLGWLADFIPYVSTETGSYVPARRKMFHSEDDETLGVEFKDLEESVTITDFILNDNGNVTNMKLIAGFLGIGQNQDTGALRPCLGWVTAIPLIEIVPVEYIIIFKDDISESDILRIREKIIEDGGSILNDWTIFKMLFVGIFENSLLWMNEDKDIQTIEKN